MNPHGPIAIVQGFAQGNIDVLEEAGVDGGFGHHRAAGQIAPLLWRQMQAPSAVRHLEAASLRLIVGAGAGNHAQKAELDATLHRGAARRETDIFFHGQLMGQGDAQQADGEPGMGDGHAPVGQGNPGQAGQQKRTARAHLSLSICAGRPPQRAKQARALQQIQPMRTENPNPKGDGKGDRQGQGATGNQGREHPQQQADGGAPSQPAQQLKSIRALPGKERADAQGQGGSQHQRHEEAVEPGRADADLAAAAERLVSQGIEGAEQHHRHRHREQQIVQQQECLPAEQPIAQAGRHRAGAHAIQDQSPAGH